MAFLEITEITQMIQSTQEVLKRTLSRIDCGTVSPSALAVLRLMTISNLVDN
jgi:hypothetical protein